jgi:hypothetical protein
MGSNCALDDGGGYVVHHDPAAYYEGADDRVACTSNDVPLGKPSGGALLTDLRGNTLPTFSFVTPDSCNDTHDCSVTTGDQWLSQWLPVILGSGAYSAGRTAVFIVWDESSPMPFISIAPSVRPGTRLDTQVDHYALLRTTEEMLGISQLLDHAGEATSMRSLLNL